MPEIRRVTSDRLSFFRTRHEFLHYGEFCSVGQYVAYRDWARDKGIPLYILGNGSNTLFTRKKVHALVLLNRLEPRIVDLGDGRMEVSSSVQLLRVLRYCEERSRGSFYFLASVPGTVGGALAMNAGGRPSPTIYDYVESVSYLAGEGVVTLFNSEVKRDIRRTQFTGIHDRLIVSAIFRFPQREREVVEGQIDKRIKWSREHQDLSLPNCGSVFGQHNRLILGQFRRFSLPTTRIPLFRTRFSRKVNNWIVTSSSSSWPTVLLIRLVQLAHRVVGKTATTELIEVR